MWQHPCWKILGIEATDHIKEIKRAYAKRSKEIHPEDHPEEFMQLHDAYEQAMAIAKHQDTQTFFVPSDIIKVSPVETNEDTSNEFDFEALFEEGNHLNEQQKENLRNTVLKEICTLLDERTSYTKWLEFTQDIKFVYVAEDTLFKDILYEIISDRKISPEANTAFYKYYTDLDDSSLETQQLLKLLDLLMQRRKDIVGKRFQNIRAILVFIVYLIFCYLAWICRSFGMMITLIILGAFLLYLNRANQHKIKQIKIMLVAIVVLIFVFQARNLNINNLYFYEFPIDQKIRERYGNHVILNQEIETDNPLYKDTQIYKCYDEENDVTFYLKEKENEQGETVFEDTLSGAFVSSLNINFTVHQKDIYPISRMYDNAEGFDIKVTAENGDAMAKELYLLVQKVCASPLYEICKDIRFYGLPEHAKFAHYARYSKTIEELSKLNEKEIKDWLFFSITAYRLDFTLWQPEKYQDDVQKYLHDASGIDILGKHYNDVHVENDKLSIGNFYRLALHLDLNIQKLYDDSLIWYTKNTTQMIGNGVTTPYIDVSLVKNYCK